MEQDKLRAREVFIALDFCSFGAFGNLAESERQVRLINLIAREVHPEGRLHIVVNSPAARKWQLQQYFPNEDWDRDKGKIWKKVNIPKFARSKRAKSTYLSASCKEMEGKTLARDRWIDFRLAYEKNVEDEFRKNKARVILFPGIVPFHAWLCDIRGGASYGTFALCHHQTAATPEVVFRVEGDAARDIMQVVEKLSSAVKPPDYLLEPEWDRIIQYPI